MNIDPQNESPDYYTKVPPHVMITLIKRMVRRMCNGTAAAEMLSTETDDVEAGYYQDSNPTYSSYKAQYRNY